MKPSCVFTTVFSLLVLGSAGCSDRSSPTGPASPINLAGTWTGAISYPQDSSAVGASCASELLNPTLSHVGRSVTARIETSCEGPLLLEGSLDGNVLTGTLTGGSRGDQFGGRVMGVASASRIELTAARSGKGESVPVCWIELTR
jgi:hypothetical protein